MFDIKTFAIICFGLLDAWGDIYFAFLWAAGWTEMSIGILPSKFCC